MSFFVSVHSGMFSPFLINSKSWCNVPFDKYSKIIVGFGLLLKLIGEHPINFVIDGKFISDKIFTSRKKCLTNSLEKSLSSWKEIFAEYIFPSILFNTF